MLRLEVKIGEADAADERIALLSWMQLIRKYLQPPLDNLYVLPPIDVGILATTDHGKRLDGPTEVSRLILDHIPMLHKAKLRPLHRQMITTNMACPCSK